MNDDKRFPLWQTAYDRRFEEAKDSGLSDILAEAIAKDYASAYTWGYLEGYIESYVQVSNERPELDIANPISLTKKLAASSGFPESYILAMAYYFKQEFKRREGNT